MKNWTIPTILKELRRVTLEMTKGKVDVMDMPPTSEVGGLIADLTRFHMDREMGVEIPGQTSIPVEDEGM